MSSLKDLRTRIASVKNTQKTTKAMKMVSAAKMRKAQDAIFAHRPYAKKIGELIRLAASHPGVNLESKLIQQSGTVSERKRVLITLITSDRGLCGAFNSNVIKTAQKWVQKNASQYERVEMAFIGKKGREAFRKAGLTQRYYEEFGNKTGFDAATRFTKWVIESYLNGEFDEVLVIYNEFKNAISQQVEIEKFLPLATVGELISEGGESAGSADLANQYVIRPNPQALLDLLVERNFAIQAYRMLLESQAGEHGARMAAMDNATNNAGEMIRQLTLVFNKTRQAGITKELLEITAGVESQKG